MKENKNNKSTVSIIIMILVVLIAVVSFTYAYFTAEIDIIDNLSIRANVSDVSSPAFIAYPEGTLDLMVTTADMLESEAGSDNDTIADSVSKNLIVSLIGGGETNGNEQICTYSLTWTNLGTKYVPSSQAKEAGLIEYTIKIVDNNGNEVLPETNVRSIKSGTTIAKDLTISSNGNLVTQFYTVTATIYNLNVVQDIYYKNYSSIVNVVDVIC